MTPSTLPFPSVSCSPSSVPASTAAVLKPHFDSQERESDFEIVVFVPGVTAAGIEITANATDLLINARKQHFVRVNFEALHLEGVQSDYQLVLRLGRSLDYAALRASFNDGVLRLTIPKKSAANYVQRTELARVA